jgi:membrane glycosyltransferase
MPSARVPARGWLQRTFRGRWQGVGGAKIALGILSEVLFSLLLALLLFLLGSIVIVLRGVGPTVL